MKEYHVGYLGVIFIFGMFELLMLMIFFQQAERVEGDLTFVIIPIAFILYFMIWYIRDMIRFRNLSSGEIERIKKEEDRRMYGDYYERR